MTALQIILAWPFIGIFVAVIGFSKKPISAKRLKMTLLLSGPIIWCTIIFALLVIKSLAGHKVNISFFILKLWDQGIPNDVY